MYGKNTKDKIEDGSGISIRNDMPLSDLKIPVKEVAQSGIPAIAEVAV